MKKAVEELARKIAALEPGALAELRRASAPSGSATFWRLWHSLDLPYSRGPWETVAQIIAILTPTGRENSKPSAHDGGRAFGKVLYEAGVSDLRVSRLLAATPEERRRTLLRLARRLAQEGGRFDLYLLARLILLEDGDQAEQAKRQLARDYFAAEADKTREHI